MPTASNRAFPHRQPDRLYCSQRWTSVIAGKKVALSK
jgi:hypothetical protein